MPTLIVFFFLSLITEIKVIKLLNFVSKLDTERFN